MRQLEEKCKHESQKNPLINSLIGKEKTAVTWSTCLVEESKNVVTSALGSTFLFFEVAAVM